MCRYAMVSYKSHYACFHCRKTFKRKLLHDVNRDQEKSVEAKCPQCGQLMASMGLDFEAPKMKDEAAWAHLKTLYSVGITFHSCGCGGPGYIPNTKEKLIQYFEELLIQYKGQLDFWRQRTEPKTQSEIDRENSKSWDYISGIPYEIRNKKKTVSNEEAKSFWIARIQETEKKLEKAGRD